LRVFEVGRQAAVLSIGFTVSFVIPPLVVKLDELPPCTAQLFRAGVHQQVQPPFELDYG